MVSHAMEDYVAVIWRLTQYGGAASTSEVARRLGVTAASTSYMFRKMAEAGLVEYKEYAGATLTVEGEAAAMGYIRRHRVTERFLVDVLGISWERADAISDQMEHALPDEVIDRMEAVMGNPLTCPHGYPIPTKEGAIATPDLKEVAAMNPGETGTVAQVAEHDPNLLSYFATHGIKPGAAVTVVAADPMGGTVTLQVGGASLVISEKTARLIRVPAAPAGAPN